ncbi:hypothetical protein BTO11_14665 [Psychrosphaera saromensis]|uniref:Uncharacterized protein n=1 Tax=Psychrosphaera saromensis TaxID=716813 RepID=A0A2S7UZR9_9GAMM|nr:hypothetical protein BTO11_14665 [Psychrosphaera saromensis]
MASYEETQSKAGEVVSRDELRVTRKGRVKRVRAVSRDEVRVARKGREKQGKAGKSSFEVRVTSFKTLQLSAYSLQPYSPIAFPP